MNSILDVQGIQTYIKQYHILQGVDLNVPTGTITALLGRNGAGKTTTLKSILGLASVVSGKIIFEGKEVQGMAPFDIASMGIGYVPEHRAIFHDLSVEENLKIAERKKGIICASGISFLTSSRISKSFSTFPVRAFLEGSSKCWPLPGR